MSTYHAELIEWMKSHRVHMMVNAYRNVINPCSRNIFLPMKHLNSKTSLFLEDFSEMDTAGVREKTARDFEVERTKVDEFQILAAYMSVGDYGCDSSAWLLLRDRTSGSLFEVHGSHCSCYGFEHQFKPEPTTLEYLNSDKFGLPCGGYDRAENANRQAIKDFLKTL